MSPRYRWTQPLCLACWNDRHPDREPVQLALEVRERETCSNCGNPTRAGIYIRINPEIARFPSLEKE